MKEKEMGMEMIKASINAPKHNLLKGDKGAITLYVTIACLFILIIRNCRIY